MAHGKNFQAHPKKFREGKKSHFMTVNLTGQKILRHIRVSQAECATLKCDPSSKKLVTPLGF